MRTDYQHEFFETTSVQDFLLKRSTQPPAGYPAVTVPDTYSPEPFADGYDARRRAFLDHCLRNPASETIKGYYYELVRIAVGVGPVHVGAIEAALDYIDERYDCSDFVLLGIIRMLHQFRDSPLLPAELLDHAKRSVLGFKYWPDEPGSDSMCTWTENHQIMFSANEMLAGSLYPDEVFLNSGHTGREKVRRARERILRWLDLRWKTGFNEWLSNVYYDEDLTALLNLADFCGDDVVSARAAMIADLLLLDMALHGFRGCFVSSHGRSYTREKQDALRESTVDTAKLAFGVGVFAGADNMSAVSLALSTKYRPPEAIVRIAASRNPVEVRSRAGIRIGEAARWGIDRKTLEGGMTLLSFEAYAHPRTFATTLRLFDAYRLWENQFFAPFARRRGLITVLRRSGLHRIVTRLFRNDLTRNTREEVNVLTRRTGDYQLSSAQDYRPGSGGDQQHPFQATLAPGSVCFITHPGSWDDASSGYWIGGGTLPRVGQHRSAAIILFNVERSPGLYRTNRLFFTHAWFPRSRFDEVVDARGVPDEHAGRADVRCDWVFARKGDGYLALTSIRPAAWYVDPGTPGGRERAMIRARMADLRPRHPASIDDANELRADGRRNIWICEAGSRSESGSFEAFVDSVLRAHVEADLRRLRIVYHSPGAGLLRFGWRGRLTADGVPVALADYPRYESEFVNAPFPAGSDPIVVDCGGFRAALDFVGCRRVVDPAL